MAKDNLISLKNPEPFIKDPISEILRNGARKLLTQALSFLLEMDRWVFGKPLAKCIRIAVFGFLLVGVSAV